MAFSLRAGCASLLVVLLAGCGGSEDDRFDPGRFSEEPPEPAGPPPAPAPEDGQGSVTLTPADPVVASSFGSWRVEWTAGPDGLAEGGGVVLQVSPFWGWSPPQISRPGMPGFTTLACSDPSARFDLTEGGVPMTVVARLASGRLEAGATVAFVYGDSTRGGPGSLSRTDRYAERFERLLIKTDGNGDGWFEPPPGQPTLRILPGPPAGLAVRAPALVAPGQEFVVGVAALDRLGSWTELPEGRLRLELRRLATGGGERVSGPQPWGDQDVGPGRRLLERPMRLDEPGLYRIEAWLTAGERELAGSNDLLLVEAGSPFEGLLFGDIHCHSALSDGTGDPEDLYAYARDVAGLDVAVVTDHDAHGVFPLDAEGSWERVIETTREAYVPGEFVTLLGYEWTSWTWGHRNVYYPALEGLPFSNLEPPTDTPPGLWEALAPYGAVTIPHHPGGGPIPIDWSVPPDEEREQVVEICSVHGSSEAPGVERSIYRPVPGASVRDALNRGYKLGILAAGDTHDGHPGRRTVGAPTNGLAAFRTRDRTREAVWRALKERQVYGTSGPRILLATDWDGTAPGTELDRVPSGPVTVRIAAPDPVQVVELVGPAGVVDRSHGGGRRTVKTFLEHSAPPASGWLYVRIVLASGEIAWESPWWLPEGRS